MTRPRALPPRRHKVIPADALELLAFDQGGVIHPTPGGGWAVLRIGSTRFCAWVPGVAA